MKNTLKVIGVIPARYESTRLKHKLLRKIGGKSLLQWTWENVISSRLLDKVIIACDHPRIKEEAEQFGARAILTLVDHASGTDRISEAVRDIEVKVVINIQADEPLLPASVINGLAEAMLFDPELVMATAKVKIEAEDEINDPNVVKVVGDKDGFAVYFSRSPIPYYRQGSAAKIYYKHLGVYAYRRDFLYTFKDLPPSCLEAAERLEQLRALEAGYKIKLIETGINSWGVDTEEDLKRVETILSAKGGAG